MLMLIGATAVPNNTFAQNTIKSGKWTFYPEIKLTNSFYQGLISIPTTVMAAVDGYRHPYLYPEFTRQWSLFNSVKTPMGKAKVRYFDWRFRSYSIGYRAGYMPELSPIGFSFGLDYEKRSLNIKLPGESKYSPYTKHMIVPSVTVNYVLGDVTSNFSNFIVGAGASYDYTFKAHRKLDSKDAVNNGFNLITQLGYKFNDDKAEIFDYGGFITVWLRYEHTLYNFFNEDYTVGGIKPYEGWKSKLGYISLTINRTIR